MACLILLITPGAAHHFDPTEVEGFEPFFTLYHLNPNGDPEYIFLGRGLSHIGIDVLSVGDHPWIIEQHLYTNLTYSEGGYDLATTNVYNGAFEAGYCNNFPQDFVTDLYMPENQCINGWAFFLTEMYYNSTEYHELFSQWHSTYNTTQQKQIFAEMMQHLRHDLPFFMISSESSYVIASEDLGLDDMGLKGMVASTMDFGTYSRGWASLNHPTLDRIVFADNDNFQDITVWMVPLFDTPPIFNYLAPVFQGLYEPDYTNDFEWGPLIAADLPTISGNGLNVTVPLRTDVVFADGTPLTAEDVVMTYRNIFTVGLWEDWYVKGLLDSPDDIVALDNHTVRFDLSFATPYFMDVLNIPIVPNHVGVYSEDLFWWEMYEQLEADLVANGTSSWGFGTGPFVMSGLVYDEYGYIQRVEYDANPSYWDGLVSLKGIDVENYWYYGDQVLDDFEAGKVQIIGPDVVLDRHQLNDHGIDVTPYSTAAEIIMKVNMRHPVIGTGVDTPLGQQQPEMAAEAARYVRQAINLALPRQELAEITNYPLTHFGEVDNMLKFDHLSLFPEANLTKAREYMEMAGYTFPENSLNSTTTEIPVVTEMQESRFITSQVLVAICLSAVVVRRRKI